MRLRILITFSGIMFACFLILSCREKDNADPVSSEEILYKEKFKEAYAHYSKPEDSLKKKSLDFILHNLSDQYYFEGGFLDQYKRCIENDSERNVTSLTNKLDSIRNEFRGVNTKVYDVNTITSSFLINSIDQAFDSWKYSWAKDLSFAEFCEYILPYKPGNEKPEYWREDCKKEFRNLMDSLQQSSAIKAVTGINDRLHWFQISLTYDYPVDIGYKMSQLVAIGTCASATRMVTYPMRTFGLPVVVDFAPNWGNRNSGHNWNALLLNKHVYPFNSVGTNIGYHKITFVGVNRMTYKPPKIFRKMFSIQDSALATLNKGKELIPANLDNKRIKDVTEEYVPASDVFITISPSQVKKQYAYLCIFDNKGWIPVYWGKISGNTIAFKNMGRDIAYLPAVYKDSTLVPLGAPFILTSEGGITTLCPQEGQGLVVDIDRKYPEDDSNTIQAGDEYELLYWNRKWISLGKQIAKEKILHFKMAPRNALFWIRDLSQGQQERIFTYFNHEIQWW